MGFKEFQSASETREGLKRLNVRISQESSDFLEKRSAESGLSKTSLVQIALESYMQSYKATSSLEGLNELSDKLTQVLEKIEK